MHDIAYIAFRGKLFRLYKGEEQEFKVSRTEEKARFVVNKDLNKISTEDWVRALKLEDSSLFNTTRRNGSIALAMAKTAAGMYEGLVLFPKGQRGGVWDIAAGTYLLQSQRFHCFDNEGNVFDYHDDSRGIIAINPQYTKSIKELLDIPIIK